MSPELALQTVVFAEIQTALPAVTCASHMPGDQVLPYIQIGQSETEDHVGGFDLTLFIHYWSSAEGPHEAKEHMQAVRSRLHGNQFTGNGWSFYVVRETFSDVILDVDEETWHGVQRIRALACSGS